MQSIKANLNRTVAAVLVFMLLATSIWLAQMGTGQERARRLFGNRAYRRARGLTRGRLLAMVPIAGGAGRFSENHSIIYVLKPADHQAGVVGDSIHGGKVHRIAFLIQFGSLTGDAVLSIYSGATAATKTTQETFRYRLADAVQGSDTADTFADWSTSSALTLTAATYQNRMLVVEIDMDELTAGQPWVTLDLDASASALNAAVAAVADPRYQAHDVPTVIA